MIIRRALYWDWVESEAAVIGTNGCSKASGAYGRCCLQHDLSYYYAKAPASAYGRYLLGEADYWSRAMIITRSTADAAFRRCIQAKSKAGFWSPMAVIRWIGVRLGGQSAWDAHRAREAQQNTGEST